VSNGRGIEWFRIWSCFAFISLAQGSGETYALLQNYKAIEKTVRGVFDSITDDELKGTYYPLLGMTKDTQNQLIADHFLFKEGDRYVSAFTFVTETQDTHTVCSFLQEANACRFWPVGRGIFHNEAKTFLVWVCEEDHLRIIRYVSNFRLTCSSCFQHATGWRHRQGAWSSQPWRARHRIESAFLSR
jgi:hypothetical protein